MLLGTYSITLVSVPDSSVGASKRLYREKLDSMDTGHKSRNRTTPHSAYEMTLGAFFKSKRSNKTRAIAALAVKLILNSLGINV